MTKQYFCEKIKKHPLTKEEIVKKFYIYEFFSIVLILGCLFILSFHWNENPDSLGFESPITSILALIAACLFLVIFLTKKPLIIISLVNSINALFLTETILTFQFFGKNDAIIFAIPLSIFIIVMIRKVAIYSKEGSVSKTRIFLSLIPKILIISIIAMLIIF